MQVNVSALKCFLNSQHEWYLRYHLKRIPKGPIPVHFLVGRWWHLLMEALDKLSIDKLVAYATVMQNFVEEENSENLTDLTLIKFRDQTDLLISLLPHMPSRFIPQETLMIEHELEMPIYLTSPSNNHTLIGRPDKVIRLHDKYWHLQYRTLSDRTSIPIYLATRPFDLHELLYAYLISGHFKCSLNEYGGTYIHIIRKLSPKAIKERPHEAFVQELIPISSDNVLDAIAQCKQIVHDMVQIVDKNRIPLHNPEFNTNRYGNVLSPYFDVFTGKLSIHDNAHFTDAPDLYPSEKIEI